MSRDRSVAADGDVAADRNVSCSMRHVRQMEAPACASTEKRNHAESEADHKTDQIEVRPGHWIRLPWEALRLRWLRTASGSSASSKRSASPGVSRIAPNSRKQLRVSLWRAHLMSTSLTSRSLTKRSEPCNNQTSSLPSVVRRSLVSSV